MSKCKFHLFHKSSGILSSQSRFLITTKQAFVGLEDVFKKSSRHALKNFSIPLQRNNFTSSETSWRPLRRQNNITLKTSWRRLEDMSWRRLEGMSWRRLENMSWRCLEDLLKVLWRQPKYLLGISVYLSRYLTNLNVYLTSLYFTNLYLTTLKRIQNALITGLVLWN